MRTLFKHYFLLIALAFSLSTLQAADSQLAFFEANIEPAPLAPLEEDGVGTVVFSILERNGIEISADAGLDTYVSLGKITLNGQSSDVTVQDMRNGGADVTSKFTVAWNSAVQQVSVTQKAGTPLPADMWYKVTIPVAVTENTPITNPNNGFLVNQNVIPGHNVVTAAEASDYTYTRDPVLAPLVILIDTIDVNETDPTTVLTKDLTPEINGVCIAGDTVTVQIDGTDITPTTVCTPAGTFSITPDTNIREGEHNVTATQTDPNTGATSEPSPVDYLTVDTTPPSPLTIDTVDGKTDNPVTTTDTTPEINGTCAYNDNGTVTIQIDGIDIAPTALCTVDGTYSVIPTTPLTISEHNVTATETDVAGNTATTNVVELIVEKNIANYAIRSSARGANVFTTEAIVPVVLTISETKGGTNSGSLQVQLPKNNKFTVTYNQRLTELNGKNLSNADWEVSEDAGSYTLTYIGNNGIYEKNTTLFIGLEVNVTTPTQSDGTLNYESVILPGTGEDSVQDRGDNTDYSSISYRNY